MECGRALAFDAVPAVGALLWGLAQPCFLDEERLAEERLAFVLVHADGWIPRRCGQGKTASTSTAASA